MSKKKAKRARKVKRRAACGNGCAEALASQEGGDIFRPGPVDQGRDRSQTGPGDQDILGLTRRAGGAFGHVECPDVMDRKARRQKLHRRRKPQSRAHQPVGRQGGQRIGGDRRRIARVIGPAQRQLEPGHVGRYFRCATGSKPRKNPGMSAP